MEESQQTHKLSIVIPVYNEAQWIETVIRRVLAIPLQNIEKELVVVDDASTDGTREILQQKFAEHPQIFIYTHEQNQGKGAALRTGFSKVTGGIVLIQDADLEYDPRDYPKLLDPILDNRADVVYGSRFLGVLIVFFSFGIILQIKC